MTGHRLAKGLAEHHAGVILEEEKSREGGVGIKYEAANHEGVALHKGGVRGFKISGIS